MTAFRACLTGVLLIVFPCLVSAGQKEYADCRICHKYLATKEIVHPPVMASCLQCHIKPHRREQPHPKGLFEEGAKLCFKCHEEYAAGAGKIVHSPALPESALGPCTRCHNAHSSENAKLLVSPVPDLCYDCHLEQKFAEKSIHAPVQSGMCTACHFAHLSENQKLLRKTGSGLCFECHAVEPFEGPVKHSAATGGKCSLCHNAHSSNHESLLNKPVNKLCAGCHRLVHKTGAFTMHPVAGKNDPQRKGRELSCISCHNPHSSAYPKLFPYKAGSREELCKYCH